MPYRIKQRRHIAAPRKQCQNIFYVFSYIFDDGNKTAQPEFAMPIGNKIQKR